MSPNVDPVAVEDVTGPYDGAVNGLCPMGHPINRSGRCEPLNAEEYPNAEAARANGATHVQRYVAPVTPPAS